MTNAEKVAAARDRHSRFVIDSSFVIRLPRRNRAKAGHSSFSARSAFTLIELVVVVGIILILAGLVLSTAGYARKKGARVRAETEIAAMSAACESYKADNGIYPRDSNSDGLAAMTNPNYPSSSPPDPIPSPTPGYDPNTTSYKNASFSLYAQLSGNTSGDRTTFNQKAYFEFKPNMLLPP